MDTFVPLDLPPGFYRQGTGYQAKGRWREGNLVRFYQGTLRPIGGWRRLAGETGAVIGAVAGVPRNITSWATEPGGEYAIAIGTTEKLYVIVDGVLSDITPGSFAPGDSDADIIGGPSVAYGAGDYGDGPYGGVGTGTERVVGPGTWQFDTFGKFLVAITNFDNALYVWEGDATTNAQLVTDAPTGTAVVTTPERFVVVLGADGEERKVQWADQETLTDWTPTTTNQAGDFTLSTNGALRTGRRTKSETLLWTTTDAWAMRYVGPPFVYQFDLIGENCGVASPNAAVTVDTLAFWMGQENFFVYDGFVRPVPCDVHDFVFGDINRAQIGKVWAVANSFFSEVWWFYPSASSAEVNRYVAYNYRENHWVTGTLARSAGVDAGVVPAPIWADPSGVLWLHETGSSRPGGSAPFAETGPIELTSASRGATQNPNLLGVGNETMLVQRIIPDERFLGNLTASLYASLWPTDPEVLTGPFPATQPTICRVRGRTVRLRLAAPAADGDWRAGLYRLGVVQSSRR
jgi:hypothetical protein